MRYPLPLQLFIFEYNLIYIIKVKIKHLKFIVPPALKSRINICQKRRRLMIRIDSSQISEGMVLAEPLFFGANNKLLLNAGTIITKSHIHTINKYKIKTVAITERYTLLIEPQAAIQKK